jgi:hypothetical protein
MEAANNDTADVLPTRYVNKNTKQNASQKVCIGLKTHPSPVTNDFCLKRKTNRLFALTSDCSVIVST